MDPIVESGMTFGPYPEGHCFYIEKSATYQAVQDEVQIAEFLLLRTPTQVEAPVVWIVEAKSSSPKPERQPHFNQFISEIREKLANALAVGIASMLKRHSLATSELPEPFKTVDLATVGFRLVLIINGHEQSWLPPLQDALRKALKATTQTWALGANAVVVLNHEKAKDHGIISAFQAANKTAA